MTTEPRTVRSTSTAAASDKPGIGEILALYCAANHISEDDLASELGMAAGSVIRQVIRGTMHLPVTLLEPLAEILEMDKFDLLDRWLRDRDRGLHALFAELRARCTLTDSELRLVDYCRKLAEEENTDPIVFNGPVIALVTAGRRRSAAV